MSARSISDSRGPSTLGSLSGGGVSERPKERASKAREGQPSAGSNPAATASLTRVNVYTSVATGVNARARPGSPVPIGAEPFRQSREHGHGRFWPLLEYGV
jgi:hypothetical protein